LYQAYRRKDPVKSAKEDLEKARLAYEAAKLQKETEKLYSELYKETLEEDEIDNFERKNKL
jgi:hypothetical protein